MCHDQDTDDDGNLIEVDSAEDRSEPGDGSSLYSSGMETDTTSLISAAKLHTFQHGRRFHGYKDGRYLMPDDEAEADRMDLAHYYMLLALDGKLNIAPLEHDPHRVLDVGTGTGIWAIDFADSHPASEVVGVDLSPIQPSWVPPNVRFEVDDIEEDWTWPANHFDYIHLRSLACWVQDWPHLISQAYRSLKPGGYIELQDLTDFFFCDDDTLPDSSYLREWIRNTALVCKKLGRPWLELPQVFKEELAIQGCEDITEWSMKCPMGPWAKDKKLKELGLYARQMKYDGAESFILAPYTRTLGWDPEEVGKFAQETRKELMDPKYHSHERFYCIYGRKPETRF